MPITFNIERNVIFTTATGILSYADVLDHIEAKRHGDVIASSELFDARRITLDISVDDLKSIASEVAKALDGKAPGRIAMVLNSAFFLGLARTYAGLSKVVNPAFEVFYDFDEARTWLMK